MAPSVRVRASAAARVRPRVRLGSPLSPVAGSVPAPVSVSGSVLVLVSVFGAASVASWAGSGRAAGAGAAALPGSSAAALPGSGAGTPTGARVMSSWGSIINAPVPPRADGRNDTVRPCLRASRPTTARPSRVPDSPARSWSVADTARSARRNCTSLITRPLSSTVSTTPAGTSSTYTWTSAVGGEKLAALSRSSARACMTPSAA